MINTIEQYEKLVNLTLSKLNNTVFPYSTTENIHLNLIIVNKFFIDQLLKEKNNEFLIEIIHKLTSNLFLFFLYGYKYISTIVFNYFYNNKIKGYDIDIKFEILEHFYNKRYENLLNKTFNINSISRQLEIIMEILYKYGRDINIFKYCVNKINQNKLYLYNKYYRMPLHFPLNILNEYLSSITLPNNYILNCEDKKLQNFINTVCSDSIIMYFENYNNINLNKYIENDFVTRYDIDVNKNYNFKVSVNNIDYSKFPNIDNYMICIKEYGEYSPSIFTKFETKINLINIINTNKNKIKYYKYNNKFEKKNIKNLNFVKKYLNDKKEIENILNNPNYLLTLNIEISIMEKIIISYCYIISLIHNECSSFIIITLLKNIINT
ncbi:hypothetical protein BCR36DRAFT_451168, partial [Piromyces finnis]